MLWDREESELHERMGHNPTPDVIHKSLKHFGVGRSFAGIASDPSALPYIADALRDITQHGNLTANEAQEKVTLLTKQFKTKFKRSNLSAASKLLWLKHLTPFIIYDSRATLALGFAKKPTYAVYCAEWRLNYESSRSAIAAASSRLCEIRGFLSSWLRSPDALSTITREDWFHERTFDVYLWETGSDG